MLALRELLLRLLLTDNDGAQPAAHTAYALPPSGDHWHAYVFPVCQISFCPLNPVSVQCRRHRYLAAAPARGFFLRCQRRCAEAGKFDPPSVFVRGTA